MRVELVVLGGLAVSLAIAGCDPAFELSGTVRSADGAPVRGAAVLVRCSVVEDRTITNDTGSFRGGGIGWREDRCVLEVVANGYTTLVHRIGDHCTKRPAHLSDACLSVRMNAILKPAGASHESEAPPN